MMQNKNAESTKEKEAVQMEKAKVYYTDFRAKLGEGLPIRILVDSKVDYGKSRNLALTSVIFVTGLSGIAVKFGDIELKGMVLASVVGMVLSLAFYILDKFHLTNDAE